MGRLWAWRVRHGRSHHRRRPAHLCRRGRGHGQGEERLWYKTAWMCHVCVLCPSCFAVLVRSESVSTGRRQRRRLRLVERAVTTPQVRVATANSNGHTTSFTSATMPVCIPLFRSLPTSLLTIVQENGNKFSKNTSFAQNQSFQICFCSVQSTTGVRRFSSPWTLDDSVDPPRHPNIRLASAVVF